MKSWLVHAIANCLTCGKSWESMDAKKLSGAHAKRTGHHVSGEEGFAFLYKAAIKASVKKETK